MKNDDQIILNALSHYLNETPKLITTNLINKIIRDGFTTKEAFEIALYTILENDGVTKAIFRRHFPLIINELQTCDFNKEFLPLEIIKKARYGNVSLRIDHYEPYEVFVCDDFKYFDNDLVLPQIGYFTKPFNYLAVYEQDRLWMSITPNEINTMKEPINQSVGVVVTLGLGLGYFAIMIANKEKVEQVIVVEKNPHVIQLFKQYILPYCQNKDKISIIEMDAFDFLENELLKYNANYLFCDLWHDVSDGLPLYHRIQTFESKYPTIKFMYWIEKTMKYYEKK